MGRRTMTESQRRASDRLAAARIHVRRHGIEAARAEADRELTQSVQDVTYPFGRVAFWDAVKTVCEAETLLRGASN